ncbi:N-acetylglucosamine-6-phosphate deacetylase-like isoform X1 [Clavelina lepadiformis]|uniref:N-acetylglucosamine-6-phosphate deacetylase n=1 Tax=Clavelina lepadiformis TaxID=159417 RepID=A0ABP0FBF9_CLALP
MSNITQYFNCRILQDHNLVWEDLWVRDGIIEDPRELFFKEKTSPQFRVDCNGLIISPGYLDIQLNGGFEVDFSSNVENVEDGVQKVSRGLLQYGVTSFCPTIVTSPDSVYKQVVPKIKTIEYEDGAGVLGVHLEGPFISTEKRGAHPVKYIKSMNGGYQSIIETYGDIKNVCIVTLAPELEQSAEVIKKLTEKNIAVSLGHSMANLMEAEKAVNQGAKLITHLFNAMLPFHHRDPGLVGLLTSHNISGKQIYYGLIADGIHTDPAAIRIAYKANPKGLILITDAIAAMGLKPGTYQLGQQCVTIKNSGAYLAGSNVLAGSIANMAQCVRFFQYASGASLEDVLEMATLHPALLLGVEKNKGTLDYGSDADFILLNDELYVQATYIAGKKVYEAPNLTTEKFLLPAAVSDN